MAEKHADAYQWHAHAAAKTAAEGVIHTAHYAPASAPVHPATQYGTANTAHYAANTAHYETANAPVHAATQYHGRANTAHYAANTAHYEPANAPVHAATQYHGRANTAHYGWVMLVDSSYNAISHGEPTKVSFFRTTGTHMV